MLHIKINIPIWFLFGIIFLYSPTIFSQQNKDSTLSISQIASADSLKKDSILHFVIKLDSSSKVTSDSSNSKNTINTKPSGDSSKLASDSSKHTGLSNKITSGGSFKILSDSTKIKNDLKRIAPLGSTKLLTDSSARKNEMNKIIPGSNTKLLTDSTIKKNLWNKLLPASSLKLGSDSSKNKNGMQNYMSKATSKIIRDSTTRKRLLKKFMPKTYGNISMGYDYGVIPFATNANYPLGYFKSQGNIGFSALGFPLLATYYYSTLKSVSGLNNSFRVSFDATRYKASLQNNGLEKVENEAKELTSLSDYKQILQQKLAFSELSKNGLPTESSLTNQLPSFKNNYNSMQADSLMKFKTPNTPSVSDSSLKDSIPKTPNTNSIKKSAYADSIDKVTSLLHKYDSLTSKINQYKTQIKNVDAKIKAINNKIAYYKNPQNLVENNPYLKKYQSVLSGIKKFDIGLCYPNYSTFLVSGSSLKGVNIEWEKKFYFAATYGKTINTVMTTNNLIQNQLQTGRNLYNFFDFNNVQNSRKIAAMKFGIGKKEGSHFYAGFLYGLGLPSYTSASTQTTVEKNLVVELDGRIALNKSNSLDLIYGKSALYQQDGSIVLNSENSGSQSLLSKYRSNGGLVRFTSVIKKTKTKITATGKIVDPFFNSYGVGFMRSDNIRYELKVDQDITSKIKFTGSYRKDRDNILNTFSYTTDLQTIGATLNIKLSKRFTAKASFMPVIQNITSKDSSSQNSHHVNNISNVVMTYSPKTKKINSFFTVMYSYYDLSGTNGKSTNFQNYNINSTTIFNPHIKANFTFNYFLNNDSDSLNSSTTMVSGDISYVIPKGATFTLGTKYSYNNIIKEQIGGLLKINFPIIKHVHLEVYGEKLVLGDFYNSYNISEIKRFPYYCYGKMIVTW